MTNNKTQNNTQYERISYIVEGHIAMIGLNRADKRNAFDSVMINELSQALTDYENDANLRCVVIFAHGDHFTAGLDLMELQDKLDDDIFTFADNRVDPWGVSGQLRRKPRVAAMQGICFTAGIELMLNCDVVIASDDCRFAQMEVQRGIMPFGGASVRFVRAAGWQKAMPYLLTGQEFDAATAERLNLVSQVVTAGTQLEHAKTMAQHICQAAPLGVQALLQSAQEAILEGEQVAYQRLHGYLPPLFASKDASEGVMAMVERRAPNFQGQ